MALHDTLRKLMEARGENSHSLSTKSGVPQPTIFRILSGESKEPRRGNIEKLAKALGTRADTLYGLEKTALPASQEDALFAELIYRQIQGLLAPLDLTMADLRGTESQVKQRIGGALSVIRSVGEVRTARIGSKAKS